MRKCIKCRYAQAHTHARTHHRSIVMVKMIHGYISTLVCPTRNGIQWIKWREKKGSSREYRINRMFQMNLLIARIVSIKSLNVRISITNAMHCIGHWVRSNGQWPVDWIAFCLFLYFDRWTFNQIAFGFFSSAFMHFIHFYLLRIWIKFFFLVYLDAWCLRNGSTSLKIWYFWKLSLVSITSNFI